MTTDVERERGAESAQAILDCLETCDLGARSGKGAIWKVMCGLGLEWKERFPKMRDGYRGEGFSVADANRMAALDVVVELGGVVRAGDRPSKPSVDKPVGPVFGGHAVGEGDVVAASKAGTFDELLRLVEESCAGKRAPGLGACVSWVSRYIRTPVERIEVSGVPGVEAISLWVWAKGNETEYRRTYDAKRIGTKGITEEDQKGFVDGGEALSDILEGLRDVGSRVQRVLKGSEDVQVRAVSEADADGIGMRGGGDMSGMSVVPVIGGGGTDTGSDGAGGDRGSAGHGMPDVGEGEHSEGGGGSCTQLPSEGGEAGGGEGEGGCVIRVEADPAAGAATFTSP
jgi:hypothetical protein